MKIEIENSPATKDELVVQKGLKQYNDQCVPAGGDGDFAVFLRNTDEVVVGGLLARAGRGWLHIGILWVAEGLRGKGYGSRLLTTAEAEGFRRGCHSAYLDTFSFQNPEFYKRCGYKVFGTLEAFPEGHQRFFMRKKLPQPAGDMHQAE